MSELDSLREENAQLRAELEGIAEKERRASERRKKILKEGGRFLFSFFDRRRVIRSFLELFDTAQGYFGPREEWPTRDEMLIRAKVFGLSLLRFFVKRRLLMLLISLLAFTVPGLQLYVTIQQNRIIENQNKYFNIQVYDTVARSMTSGDPTAKQIIAALLSREDFDMLNGITSQVFATGAGGVYNADDASSPRSLMLQEAAARAHLIAAFTAAIDYWGNEVSASALWSKVQPTMTNVLQDASYRIPVLLRFNGDLEDVEPEAVAETNRYLFNVGVFLQKTWTLAVSANERERYFAVVAPFVATLSRTRPRAFGDQQFLLVVQSSLQELLMDLALEPRLGAAATPTPTKREELNALLRQGFTRLQTGVGNQAVAWDNFKNLADVP